MALRLLSTCTILIATCLCVTSATDRNSNSNRTAIPIVATSLLRLHLSSLEECLNTCFYNQDCESVVFLRLANFCELQSIHEPPTEQNGRRGIVINRKDIEKRRLGQPTANSATHKYTNVCPLSDFTGYQRLGNRNTPGDQVILLNYGKDIPKCILATFACAETGDWLQMDCRNKSTSMTTGLFTSKPRDCDGIGRAENPQSGVFEIFPVGANDSMTVFCDFDDTDGPWTVIHRRVDGTVDFYRNYSEYQAGFGNLDGNFWLGLDKISSISLQDGKNHCLKVTVVDKVNGEKFAKYSRFQVMNVTTGYRLNVGGYTGNAGDSLTDTHNEQPFSTYDRDMDHSDANCAEQYTGAWWYNNCHKSNLNGKYGDSTSSRGINWYTTTGYDRSAISTSMKMKECLHDDNFKADGIAAG